MNLMGLKKKSVTPPHPCYMAQRRLRMGKKFIRRQRSHSHTVQVDEPALPLIALRGQEVLKVLDLIGQLWVQVELGGKLGDPVPGGGNAGAGIYTICHSRIRAAIGKRVCVGAGLTRFIN